MGRVGIIRKDPFYLECLTQNSDRERERLFCHHDYRHMATVSQISYKIMKQTGRLDEFVAEEVLSGQRAAMEVICAAGLLHDIGRWCQYDTGEDHAVAGSSMAGEVLERAGFTPREIAVITRAIREHRKFFPGQSCLGRVLCLADDLSRPCGSCAARMHCYKFDQMEIIRERNLESFKLDVI